MLNPQEAQVVAHGRLVKMVKVVQEACGALNPDPDTSQPRNEVGTYIAELGAAWDSARDGLQMLDEAENPPKAVAVTANPSWQTNS